MAQRIRLGMLSVVVDYTVDNPRHKKGCIGDCHRSRP